MTKPGKPRPVLEVVSRAGSGSPDSTPFLTPSLGVEPAVVAEALPTVHAPIDLSKWRLSQDEAHEFVIMLRASRIHAALEEVFRKDNCAGDFFQEIATGKPTTGDDHPRKRALRRAYALASCAQMAVVIERDLLKAADYVARGMFDLGALMGTSEMLPLLAPPTAEETRKVLDTKTAIEMNNRRHLENRLDKQAVLDYYDAHPELHPPNTIEAAAEAIEKARLVNARFSTLKTWISAHRRASTT
jgi:hypothetical protein